MAEKYKEANDVLDNCRDNNEVIKYSIREEERYREYQKLCDTFLYDANLDNDKKKGLLTRIRELQPQFSDGHI